MNKKIRQLAKPVVTQFKQMFSRFCNGDAKHVSYGDWSCGRGGYDKWFEIYFRGTAVCDCVSGECDWFGDTKEIGLTETDFQTIKKYIIDHYERTRFVD